MQEPRPANEPAFSPEHVRIMTETRLRARKVVRASRVAAVSGWTMVVFASITLLMGLFSLPSLVFGVGLLVVAIIELRGSRRLRQVDLTGPRLLGFNQVALCLIVVTYGTWGIIHTLVAPGPYDAYIEAGGLVAETLEPIDRLNRLITLAFYVLLIGGSLIAQTLTAVYYFTRRRHLVSFLRETPDGAVDVLRAAA